MPASEPVSNISAKKELAVIFLALALLVSLISYAIANGADARVATARPSVSTIIYPPQELPLTFSHVQHLERSMDCTQCHSRIASSASSLDNNLPRESDCAACHAIDRADVTRDNGTEPAGACAACHPGFQVGAAVRRLKMPVPNLKFSHKAHLDRGTPCQVCHGDFKAERIDLATREQLPSMQLCLQCHDDTQASAACNACHLSEAGGVMQTDFPGLGVLAPSGNLRGAAHDMEFRQFHKYAAQNDQDFCASCHKKEFCVDCHSGVQKPMDFHAGDYVNMHAIDARRNAPDCASCHRLQTFCQACHSRLGVAADGKGSEFGPTTALYHPPGWTEAGLAGRGPTHHSFEAQRNIKQCVSCHRESFCTRCHSAQPGSRQINPHPRDWIASRRCEALVKRSPRMCLRCHIEARPPSCSP